MHTDMTGRLGTRQKPWHHGGWDSEAPGTAMWWKCLDQGVVECQWTAPCQVHHCAGAGGRRTPSLGLSNGSWALGFIALQEHHHPNPVRESDSQEKISNCQKRKWMLGSQNNDKPMSHDLFPCLRKGGWIGQPLGLSSLNID